MIPALSGLQYGYQTAVIAATLLFLDTSFQMSPFQEGLVATIAMIGLIAGSFSGILANHIGRKNSLFLSVFLFILGTLFCSLAPTIHFVLCGRLLVGFGAGIAILVAPIYLIEMSSPSYRGGLLNLNQIGIASGSLLAYVCSYLFASTQNWRLMFGLALIPACLQCIGLFFIRESTDRSFLTESSWKELLKPIYRYRLLLSLSLPIIQSLSGYTAILLFAPTLFASAGFDNAQNAILATACIGTINFIMITASFWIVDRLGRRILLFTSLLGMGVSLFTIFLFSLFHSIYLETATFICILFYFGFCALGTGPLPPMIVGEISPLKIRGHMMTLMGIFGWVSAYSLSLVFLPIMDTIGLGNLLVINAFFCLSGFLILYRFLPETKQKSLQEIEDLFKKDP